MTDQELERIRLLIAMQIEDCKRDRERAAMLRAQGVPMASDKVQTATAKESRCN